MERLHGSDANSSSAPAAEPEFDREAFLRDWAPVDLTASSADYYFDSYNHYGVHEDVLKDHSTTSAYHLAIKQNAHLFRGAVVLDVSAGLGLCSLLAAQAGARRVIALESQPELVAMASRVAEHNGFGPEVLQFICGTPGTLDRLPDGLEQVDIIVSQWMGYFLMYEARLGDVLHARDRWLKPGGLMFPDRTKMYVALLENAAYKQQHFDYFGDVWGFDFSAMRDAAHGEPVVACFDHEQMISSPACVLNLDLHTCRPEDCFQMASQFQLACRREGRGHALIFWFEVRFGACHKPVAFATGPESPASCWKQTAFFLGGQPLQVKPGDQVRGMVAVRRWREDRRHLDIKIACRVNWGKQRLHYYRWT